MIPTDQDYVTSAEQQAKVAAFRGKWCLGAQSRQCSMGGEFHRPGPIIATLSCSFCGNRVAVDPFSGTDPVQDYCNHRLLLWPIKAAVD
jgi:transcription elongation factor Elf1